MPDSAEPPATERQRWAGAERRRWSREPARPAQIVGYARVRPNATRVLYRLTARVWYQVRERNPG